jgi:hypothetical protein
VKAGGTSSFNVAQVNEGIVASGICDEMVNLSLIVSILSIPANCLNKTATTVVTIMAIREPGIFLLIRGKNTIIARLSRPIAKLQKLIVEKLLK